MKTFKGEGVSKDPMKPMPKPRRPEREWDEWFELEHEIE